MCLYVFLFHVDHRPHIQEKRQQTSSQAGWAFTTAHKLYTHEAQHRPPGLLLLFVFSFGLFVSVNTNFCTLSPSSPSQVRNVPGTSPPAAESSSLPAFRRSTPTTWTAPSWSSPPKCRKSFWSSRASSWRRTLSRLPECSAATTGWRFGTDSPEVSHRRALNRKINAWNKAADDACFK